MVILVREFHWLHWYCCLVLCALSSSVKQALACPSFPCPCCINSHMIYYQNCRLSKGCEFCGIDPAWHCCWCLAACADQWAVSKWPSRDFQAFSPECNKGALTRRPIASISDSGQTTTFPAVVQVQLWYKYCCSKKLFVYYLFCIAPVSVAYSWFFGHLEPSFSCGKFALSNSLGFFTATLLSYNCKHDNRHKLLACQCSFNA